jgi:hypothetical protein
MKWDGHCARGVFAAAHVGWFSGNGEREGGSREVRRRRRLRRGRPGVGAGKAAKREDELGCEGSR